MMRVLLVDGDDRTRATVRDGLEAQQISVTDAATMADARLALAGHAFDVIISGVPREDAGLDLLAHLTSEAPGSHVIVLSAAASELDRVRGLQLGADDYVVKPFSVAELTARVLAVRRRRHPDVPTRLGFGHVEVDLAARRLVVGGRAVEMPPTEFALLAFLATRAGQVFTRSQLLSAVWDSNAAWQSNATVTEHVRRVRNRIEIDPHRPVLLRTVRGVGYCFDLPVDPTVS